jgi:serine/threonine-protein kinase
MIGRTLSHFRITAKIGEGGMGIVYRAEDETLRRPVALKVLPPELVKDEERRLRFLREARAAAAVVHPNIATIFEAGEAEGVVFIAMELVEGRTLASLIGGRPLAIREAVRLGAEIAAGLARAHQSQVIHRDLKPENILVGPDGQPKILDFGLARLMEPARGARPEPVGEREKAAAEGLGGGTGERPGAGERLGAEDLSQLETISGEMTRAGRILGTAAYMSPEQARGDPVDARTDIFSFGVTLYEMVTGRAPFQGRTATDVLSAITRDEPPAPSQINPTVPPELERIVTKCLEKEPGERYQDTRDLAVDLRKLRQKTETGSLARAGAMGKQRRAPVAATAVVASALIAAVALALGFNVGGVRGWLSGASAPVRVESLAVLPLENLSGDPEQEYFSDGMTEALISHLAKSRDLRVISRTSVMRYKGTRKPLPEIARDLNVEAIVEGSVLRAGDRVRITAQLVEAASDRHLWAESYERDLRDILALQSEVARAIASEIRVTLAPPAAASPGSGGRAAERQVDPEAYEAYLKGRHHWYKRTEDGMRKGLSFFEQAIEKDPSYAPAYAGLADAYTTLAAYGHLPGNQAIPRAREAALKSLELDGGLAEGHTALARILADHDWNNAAAEREFRKAIDLNPNYALAHLWYSRLLISQRREEESLAETRQALHLDPLSPLASASVAESFYWFRRYDEAIEQARKALEIDPDYFYTHHVLGMALREKGNLREAIVELGKAVELSGRAQWIVGHLACAHAKSGDRNAAIRLVAELRAAFERGIESATSIAMVHAELDEHDEAFRWLERAYERRGSGLRFSNVIPQFDRLRGDPRFKDLLRRVNLPAD